MKGRGKPPVLPEPPGSWFGHKIAPGTKQEIFPSPRPKTPSRFKNRIRPQYSAENPFSAYDNRPEAGPDNQRTRRMNSSLNHRAVYETKNITPLAKTPLDPNFRRYSKAPKPITPAFDSRSVQLG
ncbi:Oidioi.mRNA.OKI2018_I69.chr2.g7772.t1.cds [Oikopleura dioica]|uniref:Oidioi.mRNA.OKI2018_I69.chr2.g7772.t1.cds n=1 Tax=Oikopleura dioica TaxID=34765 RepID=A0ABN7TBV6_OIKDI|nr:Oidioi.mRNA.OKI2018_I69.chr2.g7772.t1.cds [Oikopleura dioica]